MADELRLFIVAVENLATGEKWECGINSTEPATALAKFLRRRHTCEFLLDNSHPFKFTAFERE
jgi:hypothetical protein